MIDRRSFVGGLISLPFINFNTVPVDKVLDKITDVTKQRLLGDINHNAICIMYRVLNEGNMKFISIHLDMPLDFIESIKTTCDEIYGDELDINKYILFIKDEHAWSAKYMLDNCDMSPALVFPQWLTWRPIKPITIE